MPTPAMTEKVRSEREFTQYSLSLFFQVPFLEELLCFTFGLFAFSNCTRRHNPFSANFTKWSNTLKQFVGNMPKNCLSVFDHFVGLMLKDIIQHSNLL